MSLDINSIRTSIHMEVMTVKGYTKNGYKLGRIEFNDSDHFIAPWYGPQEGFYSKLNLGQKVITKKIVGETRLCHIIGLVRNSVEDTEGINTGRLYEKIINTFIDPQEDVVMVYKRGIGALLFSDEEISLLSQGGHGLKISKKPNSMEANLIFSAESSTFFDNGMERLSGGLFIPRSKSASSSTLSIDNFGNFDDKFYKKFKRVGFFTESRVSELKSRLNLPRNYNRDTKKHFSSGFKGFDSMVKSLIDGVDLPVGKVYKEIASNMFLRHFFLPNEALTSISGGLFSEAGYEYDINFNEMKYGNNGLRTKSYVDLKRSEALFKRGQSRFLMTNNSVFNEKDVGGSIRNNNFTISDREGLTKVNLSKSTFLGNIPIITDLSKDGSTIEGKNKEERNPIVYISKSGNKVPNTPSPLRPSGIRFDGISKDNRSSHNNSFRASLTSHHNMFAAAEQLLANYTKKIATTDSGGKISRENFERWDGVATYEDSDSVSPMVHGETGNIAKGSSFIVVGPTAPAISPGGNKRTMFVAGRDISKDRALSNDFKVKPEGGYSKNENFQSSGGYSYLLESAGAIVASIGKSDSDGVSLIMDTEGSVVSWIGKDNNGRSIVTQTDGSINICVGGPELNKDSNVEFHEGRFEMRVNVTDKGFAGGENGSTKSSDYVISISKDGLVVSGGGVNAPILISSRGDLNLESQNGNVNLVANKGKIRYKRASAEFSEVGYKDSESVVTGSLLEQAIKDFGVS